MSNYIVSARKYRPQNFNTVVGQSHITTTLKNAILQNHLAHAFLFCGPRGVGKTTCARILAKTINCTNITVDGEACNHCESCILFEQGTSFNIHEIDAASNNKSEDIRDLIEQVRYAPANGKYKIFIIDEVHMLSLSAFNVFLKTLEEPPPYAIFILATTEKNKIIPTILSRCQIFDFKRINLKDTVNLLTEIANKEGINVETKALELIAHKSEGCLRDSLSLLDKIVSFTNGEVNYANTLEHLNILDDDNFFILLDYIKKEDLSNILLQFDIIYKKGFEGNVFLNYFQSFLRNVLLFKSLGTENMMDVLESFKEKYIALAADIDSFYIITLLNILNEGEIQYKDSYNKRLHTELILIKICYLQKAISVVQNNEQVLDTQPKFKQNAVLKFKQIELIKSVPPVNKKNTQPSSTNIISDVKSEPISIKNDEPTNTLINNEKHTANKHLTALNNKGADLLNAISNKIKDEKIILVSDSKPLDIITLNEIWKKYINKLEKLNKNINAKNLEILQLNIINDLKFEIIFPNTISKNIFDLDRKEILEDIYVAFNNTGIHWEYTIKPQNNEEEVPAMNRLNNSEKLNVLMNKNTHLKALVEELKLGLT